MCTKERQMIGALKHSADTLLVLDERLEKMEATIQSLTEKLYSEVQERLQLEKNMIQFKLDSSKNLKKALIRRVAKEYVSNDLASKVKTDTTRGLQGFETPKRFRDFETLKRFRGSVEERDKTDANSPKDADPKRDANSPKDADPKRDASPKRDANSPKDAYPKRDASPKRDANSPKDADPKRDTDPKRGLGIDPNGFSSLSVTTTKSQKPQDYENTVPAVDSLKIPRPFFESFVRERIEVFVICTSED
ncbi:hypothetical protein HYFRA_00006256 [Hymenoscyphus fraxineus]|uniref:Uncharacterized protein n=1 Tax=Hymenoscyphus fraxineus TaxID=746836 RepID=A0A9N9PVT1_9HELO|nr:hypothetical protein HYFRA_00006256 [Hymenoscyphus fraxineus]